MKERRTTYVTILAVLVSACAFVGAFPPFDLGGLAWVALVPLFLAIRGRSPAEAFWIGYMWGAIALGGVLWWLTTFGPVVWALAAAFLGVFPGLTLAAVAWVEQGGRRSGDVLLIAALWTALEFLRSRGPLGFPWALLGESQYRALLVSQVVSVTGIYGLSYLIVLVNVALSRIAPRREAAVSLALSALALTGALAWGSAALRAPVSSSSTFIAAIVQPNYAPRLTWNAAQAERDLDSLGRLTHQAAREGAALIVWPETASPTDIVGDPATLAQIRGWATRDRVSLIASSLEGNLTNSAFSVTPDGVVVGRYDKVRLVPFAEFGERAGRGPAVLDTPLGRIGMAICIESTFPEIARHSVAGGADLLAVITNDAWFDGRTAPLQHAAIAPFRAIEEGRYLLRAANSGPSEIIDPHGRVIAALPQGAQGVLAARVAARGELTPYERFGYLFGWATVLTGGILLVWRNVPSLRAAARDAAFVRLLTTSVVPLAALAVTAWRLGADSPGLVVRGMPIPLPILALLATVILLSRGRSARDLGFQAAGFVPAAAIGLACVAGLTVVAGRAVAAHGGVPSFVPPIGGWVLGGAVQVVIVGFTLEWWLRGLVFSSASAWRGWRVGLLWAAVLGAVAAAPRGAEAIVWGLFSGLLFGVIRARWAQVPALAVAHGAGNILLGFLISSW
jgi:apolipoprotein N-acyltransferase